MLLTFSEGISGHSFQARFSGSIFVEWCSVWKFDFLFPCVSITPPHLWWVARGNVCIKRLLPSRPPARPINQWLLPRSSPSSLPHDPRIAASHSPHHSTPCPPSTMVLLLPTQSHFCLSLCQAITPAPAPARSHNTLFGHHDRALLTGHGG